MGHMQKLLEGSQGTEQPAILSLPGSRATPSGAGSSVSAKGGGEGGRLLRPPEVAGEAGFRV